VEWLKHLALVAASVAVVFLCAEVVVRLSLGFVEPANAGRVRPRLFEPTEMPGVRYTMRPNAEGKQRFRSDPRGYFDPDGSLTYRTNALGFRGPETTEAKPEGVFRIIGLGDSFTFGRGVRADATFLADLQRRLDQTSPGSFEVLNWGVAGYDTVDEANLLKHRGPAFSPDLVVLCFFLNDTKAGATVHTFNPVSNRKRLPAWRRASALLDQLGARLARRGRVRELVASYHAAYRENAPGWQRARAALTQARDQARAEGFTLVVMLFPVLWDLSGPSPFVDLHAKVAGFAESLGLPLLDLLPAFPGHDGPELWAHPMDQHPSPEGHAIAGEALFAFLREQRLLPLD